MKQEEEEENVSRVKPLYDAFSRCDISSALNMFADDTILHGPAEADVLPGGGVYDGRGGAAKFFKGLGVLL